MKKYSLVIISFIFITSLMAQRDIGIFQKQTEIGDTKQGSSKYNAQTQHYTLEGSGNNICFNNY
jgi:hypothetical protein